MRRFDVFSALSEIGRSESRRTGDFQIRCPFHSGGKEVNPSARLYIETDSIHCFTCHRSWVPVALVAEGLGISFGEAANYIRSKYGGLEPTIVSKADVSIVNIMYSIVRMPSTQRLETLRDFDEILVSASRGESQRAIETACRGFVLSKFGSLVG